MNTIESGKETVLDPHALHEYAVDDGADSGEDCSKGTEDDIQFPLGARIALGLRPEDQRVQVDAKVETCPASQLNWNAHRMEWLLTE